MSPVVVLFLFFSFLGVLLSILFLFKKKGDRLGNLLLSFYTLLFSLELLNNCLRWSGHLTESAFVHLTFTHFPFWLAYGPLVFFYVRRVLNGSGLRKWDVVFAIPPVILIGLLWPFYSLPTTVKQQVVEQDRIHEHINLPSYGIWIIILLMFFYAFYTLRAFRKKRLGFREQRWLKWFVGSYLGFVIAFTSYIFLVRFGLMDPEYDYFIDLLIVFFIAMLAFFGFVQPEIFEGKPLNAFVPFIKYRKTGLTPSLSLEMKDRLLEIMERDKPYLINELRLDDLSKSLNLSRNHTSQIINEHFNLSFFDFVNKFRVEEAKHLLMNLQAEQRSIKQISYDVGFNNRASFYKAFKKFTDSNPTNYIKHSRAS